MPIYTKESLEILRQRIDLVEVLSSHLPLTRAGSSYKACCPFHEEKTPSFIVQRGETHYHCYGCGAHGDAIAFLMSYMKMSFVQALESLAERFQVDLVKVEDAQQQEKGPSKAALKNALEKAAHFYHFALLYSTEGHAALQYLYQRGIDLHFIQTFQIGFAPKHSTSLQRILKAQGIEEEILQHAGLMTLSSTGKKRDFFNDRITFPIHDALGAVIGFSARKFKEETFGGKYINTPETLLFKKSHVLFGLNFSRQRIAKERKAIIVEGQIDALRLIHSGLDLAVAGQGTAFGEGHVKELLHLGVNQVYLALDADQAGQEAAVKIGNLFQKKGVGVSILKLPQGSDPDSFLREKGLSSFLKLMEEATDYISFLVTHFSKNLDLSSPSQKNELVQKSAKMIQEWEHPVMVHESLRKLAEIVKVPESALGLQVAEFPKTFIKRADYAGFHSVDPDRILETDLLRWLFLMGQTKPNICQMVKKNITENHFRVGICKRIFSLYMKTNEERRPCDLFSLGMELKDAEDQAFLSEIMQKKVNLQKAEDAVKETIRQFLLREWMQQREEIKMKIQSGECSEDEVIDLARKFDEIKKQPPEFA